MKGIRALLVLLVVGSVVTAVACSAVDARRTRSNRSRRSRRSDLTAEPTRQLDRPHAATSTTGSTRRCRRSPRPTSRASRSPGTRASPIPTKGKPNFTGSFAEAEPVVYSGTMYMPDSKGNVFAFDAVTGERLWYYKPKYPKGFAAGLPTSRGVVIGDGKVFMAQTDGSDRRSRPEHRPRRLEDGRRRLQAGLLLHEPADVHQRHADHRHVRRRLRRPRARSSRSTPRPARSSGRSTSSRPASSSAPTRGRRSAPTSAAAPSGHRSPSTRRSASSTSASATRSRTTATSAGKGKELFTESVVALNMNTGKYRWHYQTVHHDIWDYDTAANPLVALRPERSRGRTAQGDRQHGQDGLDLHPRPPQRQADPRHPREGRSRSRAGQHTWPTQPIPIGQPFAAQCPRQAPGRSGRHRTASR